MTATPKPLTIRKGTKWKSRNPYELKEPVTVEVTAGDLLAYTREGDHRLHHISVDEFLRWFEPLEEAPDADA